MKKRKVASLVILFIIFLMFTGCGSQNQEKQSGKQVIRVGSKEFTENLILSELYALALEENGYQVERITGIAGSVIHSSIINDEIDLYPEYTGTSLLSILKLNMMTDPVEVYNKVKEEYKNQFSLICLDYSDVNDGQGLVIGTEVAKKYGIYNISDLQAQSDKIRFASQGDFDLREDALPRLQEIYGTFSFLSSKIYENGLKYQLISKGEVDVAPAYTTEGQLVNKDYTLLTDDKQAWPPYNVVPVVRENILNANPDIEEILNQLSSTLTTEKMTELNAQVDIDKMEYEEVAQAYFDSDVKPLLLQEK